MFAECRGIHFNFDRLRCAKILTVPRPIPIGHFA